MKKYRKKPVVIEAIQIEVDSSKKSMEKYQKLVPGSRIEFADMAGPNSQMQLNTTVPWLIIPTLEGEHWAKDGDYIIKGIQDEFYPCKPDIFEKTYEEVSA